MICNWLKTLRKNYIQLNTTHLHALVLFAWFDRLEAMYNQLFSLLLSFFLSVTGRSMSSKRICIYATILHRIFFSSPLFFFFFSFSFLCTNPFYMNKHTHSFDSWNEYVLVRLQLKLSGDTLFFSCLDTSTVSFSLLFAFFSLLIQYL